MIEKYHSNRQRIDKSQMKIDEDRQEIDGNLMNNRLKLMKKPDKKWKEIEK